MDAGESCSRQLIRQGLDGELLDAVIVSHYHPDHISGIFMLVQMLYLQGRTKDLHVFLPEREDELMCLLEFQYTFPKRMGYKIIPHSMEELSSCYPAFSMMLTDHLLGYQKIIQTNNLKNQMRSWAYKIGKLVFSSDIQTTDCIQPFFEGCHTIIVDALHPEPVQIKKLADTRIRRIILSHSPRMETIQWALDNHPNRFELAQEAYEYFIDE